MRTLLLALLLASAPATALAQSDDEETKTDVVHLKDGSVVRGLILDRVEGRSLLIRKNGGTRMTLEWSQIASIEGEGAPAARAATAASSVENGASPPAPAQEPIDADVFPGHTLLRPALEGALVFGGTTSNRRASFVYLGVGLSFSLRLRVGMRFPRQEGGNWHGGGLEGSLGVYGAAAVYENTKRPYLSNELSPMVNANGAFTPGYQFYHFGAVDPANQTQTSFGFFLGCRLGVAYTRIQQKELGTYSHAAFQYGPQITLTVPRFHVKSKKRGGISITNGVYFIGDYLMAQTSLGGEF